MRCSLLSLSSYLDSELEPERAGELEAHLIGCTRCSTALGYLREESQRIGALGRAHVEDHAAHELFALVGLSSEEHSPPPNGGWHDEPPEYTPADPWIGDAPGRALPWAPRQQPHHDEGTHTPIEDDVHHDIDESAMAPEPSPVSEQEELFEEIEEPVSEPIAVEPAPIEPAPVEPVQFEPAAIEPTHVEPESIQPPAYIESGDMASIGPPMHDQAADISGIPEPRPVEATGVSRFLNRVRDSVAVRLALMRGAPAEDDDAVQIVSGGGAPSWEGRPVHRSYMQRMEERRRTWATPSQHPAAQAPATTDIPEEVEVEREAQGRPMPYTTRPDFAEQAQREAAIATAIAPPQIDASQLHETDIDDIPETRPAPNGPPVQAPPGRHMRSVTRTQGGGRFGGFSQLSAAVARRTGAQHGPSQIAGTDRRLWIFGASVVVLMLIGVLVGKASTPLPSASTGVTQHPAATAPAHASTPATAAPSVAPTTAPTAAPTAAAVAGPNALTDVIDLGTGGTGFDVAGLRYSAHGPDGYRIVFDMNGGPHSTGTPNVRIGFGNATTMYIEFSGTVAAGAPQPPAGGGVVTGLTLMQPSPVQGKIVYQVTLTRNVNFVANYLEGPRLVIDLK